MLILISSLKKKRISLKPAFILVPHRQIFQWYHSVRKISIGSNNWLIETNAHFRINPGQEKIGKKCKRSGQKLVFSPQFLYIILWWNAVNSVKFCKFTARVSGEFTKIHRLSSLSTNYRPGNDSNLSHPASQPLLLPRLTSNSNLSYLFWN